MAIDEQGYDLVSESLNAVGMPYLNGHESTNSVAAATDRAGFAISVALLEVANAIKELKDELKEIPFTDG